MMSGDESLTDPKSARFLEWIRYTCDCGWIIDCRLAFNDGYGPETNCKMCGGQYPEDFYLPLRFITYDGDIIE